MKILIFGLPGSGKSTLAEPFAKDIGGVWINADDVRAEYDDWDFSLEGRIRQAQRMRHLSDGVVMAGKIAIADFVCPTMRTRQEFSADYSVWMDTIKLGKYEDTNQLFEKPTDDFIRTDYIVSEWFTDTHKQLTKVVERFQELHVQ